MESTVWQKMYRDNTVQYVKIHAGLILQKNRIAILKKGWYNQLKKWLSENYNFLLDYLKTEERIATENKVGHLKKGKIMKTEWILRNWGWTKWGTFLCVLLLVESTMVVCVVCNYVVSLIFIYTHNKKA